MGKSEASKLKKNARKKEKRRLAANARNSGVTDDVAAASFDIQGNSVTSTSVESLNVKPESSNNSSSVDEVATIKNMINDFSWLSLATYAFSFTEIQAISIPRRAYKIVAPLYGYERTLGVIGVEALTTTVLNYAMFYCTLYMDDNQRTLNTLLSNVMASSGQEPVGVPPELYSLAKVGICTAIISAALYTITEATVRYVERDFKFRSTDAYFKNHYDNSTDQSNSLKMASLPDASVIPTIPKDLGSVIRGSNFIFVSALSATLNGLNALYTIYNLSDIDKEGFFSFRNMLGAKVLCAGVIAVGSFVISDLYAKANKEVGVPLAVAQSVENFCNRNPINIASLKGEEFSRDLIQEATNKTRGPQDITTILETIMKGWHDLSKKANLVLDSFLTIYRASNVAGISARDNTSTLLKLNQLTVFLGWSTENAKIIAETNAGLAKLEKYYKMANEPRETTFARNFTDPTMPPRITLVEGLTMFVYDRDKGVSIKKIELTENVNIPLTSMKSGTEQPARISVVGNSGSGKTQLLKALAGVGDTREISFQGTICFSAEGIRNNILLIPQNVSFWPNTSFLEILRFPRKPDDVLSDKERKECSEEEKKILIEARNGGIINRAQALFNEIDMGADFEKYFKDITTKHKDWDKLSGGMTKALSLVQAILRDPAPKILLLDETRGAIDAPRIPKLERMMNREFPKTAIIEICHPEKPIDPKTHPFFTDVLNLSEYTVNAAVTPINSLANSPVKENRTFASRVRGDHSGIFSISNLIKRFNSWEEIPRSGGSEAKSRSSEDSEVNSFTRHMSLVNIEDNRAIVSNSYVEQISRDRGVVNREMH